MSQAYNTEDEIARVAQHLAGKDQKSDFELAAEAAEDLARQIRALDPELEEKR